MIKLVPKRIEDMDFTPYGQWFDLLKPERGTGPVNTDKGDGWEDSDTRFPVIDLPGNLGYTRGAAMPYEAAVMERHAHTQEAMFCSDEPIVFLVAPPTDGPRPSAADCEAVLLSPGQVIRMERGVWHSPSRGLTRPAAYFYIAYCFKGEPTDWADIEGGPIFIEQP